MNGAGNAVLELQVHFGYGVFGENRGVRDVTCNQVSALVGRLSCYVQSKCSVRMAADSTMLRIVNLFIALSLGVHLEQLEQRIGLT